MTLSASRRRTPVATCDERISCTIGGISNQPGMMQMMKCIQQALADEAMVIDRSD